MSVLASGWHSAAAIWSSGLVFAVVHSVLALRGVKSRMLRAGISARAYRIGYVVLALITTLIWLWFVHGLPDTPLYRIDGIGRWLLHCVQLLGLVVFWLSLRPIDTGAFLGLRPFTDNTEPFIERGIYRHVRHPMYSGVMLMLFAMPAQSVNSLNLFAVIAVYFIIGAHLEERRMLADHPEYADYRRRVPAFIPRPWEKVR